MKSQKIQMGLLFDSVDEKGVLVKSVEQGWGLDRTPNIEEKKELMIPHNVLSVCISNATFRPYITKCAYFSLWHFIQNFISLSTDKILTWY